MCYHKKLKEKKEREEGREREGAGAKGGKHIRGITSVKFMESVL